MRKLLPALLLGAGLLILAALPTVADSPKKAESESTDANKIAKLIEQLGSDTFAERKKASEALDKIGEPALPALRKALTSKDAETRKRAADLVTRIEKRITSARILTPTRVHLVFKDTPIDKAVEEISKKTGYTVKLHDPDGKLKGKKITLDTGKTTFWDALNQFCAKAGLVDGNPNQVNRGPLVPPGGKVPPVNIKPPGVKPAPGGKPAAAPVPPVKKEEVKVQIQGQPGVAIAIAVQVKPGQAPAILPAQPGGPGVIAQPLPAIRWVQVQQGEIYLMPGKPAQKAVDTTTSVRIRPADQKMMPNFQQADKDHIFLTLEASPEPKVRWQRLVTVKIDKALDDKGQKLTAVDATAGPGPGVFPGGRGGGIQPGVVIMPFPGIWSPSGLYQYVPVKLKKGDKETKSLKELSGTISAVVLDSAEQMLVVDNVMKAAGKTVKGKKDGELKITKVEKAKDGNITIEFDMETPAGVVPETQVNIPIPEGAIPNRPGVVPLPPVKGKPVPAPAPAPGKKDTAPAPARNAPAAAAQAKPAQAQPGVVGKPGAVGGGIGIAVPPGGGVMLPRTMNYAINGLTLQDAKGKLLYATITFDFNKLKGRGGFGFPGGKPQKMSYIATYRPLKGQPAEPTKLVFTGRRTLDVNIPFTLKNVDVK
jgi:hypothetical protein